MVPSMLIKEPGCQIRSRLIEKIAKERKNVCTPYYMAIPEEKEIGIVRYMLRKWNDKYRESSGS